MLISNPSLAIAAAVFAVSCLGVFVYASIRIVQVMYSRPSEKLITINIDRKFFPLMGNLLMVYIFLYSAILSISQIEKAFFMSNDELTFKGTLGSSFLSKYVQARVPGGCDHIEVNGEYPITYLSADENPDLCGISPETLNNEQHALMGENNGKTLFLIGDWPFSYEIVYKGSVEKDIRG